MAVDVHYWTYPVCGVQNSVSALLPSSSYTPVAVELVHVLNLTGIHLDDSSHQTALYHYYDDSLSYQIHTSVHNLVDTNLADDHNPACIHGI